MGLLTKPSKHRAKFTTHSETGRKTTSTLSVTDHGSSTTDNFQNVTIVRRSLLTANETKFFHGLKLPLRQSTYFLPNSHLDDDQYVD